MIINNRVVKSITPEGTIELMEKAINFDEANLGFTEDEMKEIKTDTVLKNHAIKVEHQISRLQEFCTQYRCIQDIIELNIDNKRKGVFCRNCKYDEILYRQKDNYHLTKNLLLDNGTLTLMESKKIDECPNCGRTFDKATLNKAGGLCPLCSHVDNLVDEPKDPTNVYIKYRYLLDPFARTVALLFRKTRVAAEDSQYVVLRVGKKTKIYDKSNATDKGYLHLEVERPKGNRE